MRTSLQSPTRIPYATWRALVSTVDEPDNGGAFHYSLVEITLFCRPPNVMSPGSDKLAPQSVDSARRDCAARNQARYRSRAQSHSATPDVVDLIDRQKLDAGDRVRAFAEP
jgi:hypothetical protein